MQGKFKLVVLYNVGHTMHEDDPYGTAQNFYDMVETFRIPSSIKECQRLHEVGIGKFKPILKPFPNK